MQQNNKTKLTQQGYNELVAELEERKTKTRQKIADEIDIARQQGDLSENSAYKSALENKEFNENRIGKLEELLKNVEIVGETKTGVVSIGNTIKVKQTATGNVKQYNIVGETEADPSKNSISHGSPLGSAFIGKKAGEQVKVKTPGGEISFEIISIK